eukprot:s2340_g26.t1
MWVSWWKTCWQRKLPKLKPRHARRTTAFLVETADLAQHRGSPAVMGLHMLTGQAFGDPPEHIRCGMVSSCGPWVWHQPDTLWSGRPPETRVEGATGLIGRTCGSPDAELHDAGIRSREEWFVDLELPDLDAEPGMVFLHQAAATFLA